MSMKQTGGSTRYSQSGYLANRHLDGGLPEKRKKLAGPGRIVFILIALGFIAMETFVKPQDELVTTVKPIEESYMFATHKECLDKLTQLKSQHRNIKGLRCVPNGSSN